MNGKNRKDIKPGLKVAIVLKQDQRTGKKTPGLEAWGATIVGDYQLRWYEVRAIMAI
jgi:hypothetical protein